jgi:hypothetical protein
VRARRLLAGALASVCAAALLAGCTRAEPAGDTSCPTRLAAAVQDRGVVGGVPTLKVAEVTIRAVPSPTLAETFRGCVIRVRFVFQRDLGDFVEAMAPGGQSTVNAMTGSLVRDGWRIRPGHDTVLDGPGGTRAQLYWLGEKDVARALPGGFTVPADSAFAHGPIAFLDVIPPRPNLRDIGG